MFLDSCSHLSYQSMKDPALIIRYHQDLQKHSMTSAGNPLEAPDMSSEASVPQFLHSFMLSPSLLQLHQDKENVLLWRLEKVPANVTQAGPNFTIIHESCRRFSLEELIICSCLRKLSIFPQIIGHVSPEHLLHCKRALPEHEGNQGLGGCCPREGEVGEICHEIQGVGGSVCKP